MRKLDHRIDPLDMTQPKIKRDIEMRRRQPRVVIIRFALRRATTIRLDCNDHLAKPQGTKLKAPCSTCGSASGAPQAATIAARNVSRQRGECFFIGCER